MASPISKFPELNLLLGEEFTVVAFKGNNYKVRIDRLGSFISKDTLGLSNVDNTSDLDKPISKATQDALNTLSSQIFTGNASVVMKRAEW